MIEKNSSLIWYTKNYTALDDEAIAEALFNFGSWETIQEFHKTVGLAQAKALFHSLNSKKRSNLRPIVRNYFTLYYDTHAS